MERQGDRQPLRWRLILSIAGLIGLGIAAVIAAVMVESDFVAGGLVGVANTSAAGVAYGLGKLIEKD